MAKARMIHKKISLSLQVNRLCEKAQLLFTWMISHADDDGKLRGEAEYIKATVVPLKRWTLKQIEKYLEEIKYQGLIHRWEENGEWVVEFPKWKEYQYIAPAKYKPSSLPPFSDKKDDQKTAICQPTVNQEASQSNPIESNKNEIKANLREANKSEEGKDAVENHFRETSWGIDPRSFRPSNAGETAALEAWHALEPNNYPAFSHTYYHAYKQGLPTDLFYKFVSEIKQDPAVKNAGAIFNKKAEDYLLSHRKK